MKRQLLLLSMSYRHLIIKLFNVSVVSELDQSARCSIVGDQTSLTPFPFRDVVCWSDTCAFKFFFCNLLVGGPKTLISTGFNTLLHWFWVSGFLIDFS